MKSGLKSLAVLALAAGASCDGSGSILFERTIDLDPRMKTQFEFEAPAETALLAEVISNGAV